jgi:LysM domain
MGAQPARNSARLLAPIALGLFAVLFFVAILTSGSDDGPTRPDRAAVNTKRASKHAAKRPARRGPAIYRVKVGDNLPGIASKTGLTVEQIQELNPELDPYGLQSGQKIKLRE